MNLQTDTQRNEQWPLYVLAGGKLTHDGPQAAEVNKLNLTVFGNVGVDVNGLIDVTGKGYAATKGPGYGSGGSYSECDGRNGGHQAHSAVNLA